LVTLCDAVRAVKYGFNFVVLVGDVSKVVYFYAFRNLKKMRLRSIYGKRTESRSEGLIKIFKKILNP
jgi:hypothetical protein